MKRLVRSEKDMKKKSAGMLVKKLWSEEKPEKAAVNWL